jgi:hypothetical protein
MSKKLYFPKQAKKIEAEISELKPILARQKEQTPKLKARLENLRKKVEAQGRRIATRIRSKEEEEFLQKLKDKYKPPSEKMREAEVAKKRREEEDAEKARVEQRSEDIRTALVGLPAEIRALLLSAAAAGTPGAAPGAAASGPATTLPVGPIASSIGLTGLLSFKTRLNRSEEMLRGELRSALRASSGANDLKALFDNKLTENQNIQLLATADKAQLDALRRLPVMKPELRDFLDTLHSRA